MLPSPHSEQHLLRCMSAGEATAFSQLFNKYWDKVYSAAFAFTKSSQLAEDITQEVFMHLWQKRVDASLIDNLEAYLFIATRNLVYNKLSRMKVEEAYDNYLKLYAPQTITDPETTVEVRELHGIIESGIQRLPPQQQRAFRLSRERGLSHVEISQQLGVSRATVKDYIVKALLFLRRYLQEHTLLFFFYLWLLNN